MEFSRRDFYFCLVCSCSLDVSGLESGHGSRRQLLFTEADETRVYSLCLSICLRKAMAISGVELKSG